MRWERATGSLTEDEAKDLVYNLTDIYTNVELKILERGKNIVGLTPQR